MPSERSAPICDALIYTFGKVSKAVTLRCMAQGHENGLPPPISDG